MVYFLSQNIEAHILVLATKGKENIFNLGVFAIELPLLYFLNCLGIFYQEEDGNKRCSTNLVG